MEANSQSSEFSTVEHPVFSRIKLGLKSGEKIVWRHVLSPTTPTTTRSILNGLSFKFYILGIALVLFLIISFSVENPNMNTGSPLAIWALSFLIFAVAILSFLKRRFVDEGIWDHDCDTYDCAVLTNRRLHLFNRNERRARSFRPQEIKSVSAISRDNVPMLKVSTIYSDDAVFLIGNRNFDELAERINAHLLGKEIS